MLFKILFMKKGLVVLLLLATLLVTPTSLSAQCAMCKATAEGAAGEGSKKADGINKGVLYLLVCPFIFGGVGYFLYKERKKKMAEIDALR